MGGLTLKFVGSDRVHPDQATERAAISWYESVEREHCSVDDELDLLPPSGWCSFDERVFIDADTVVEAHLSGISKGSAIVARVLRPIPDSSFTRRLGTERESKLLCKIHETEEIAHRHTAALSKTLLSSKDFVTCGRCGASIPESRLTSTRCPVCSEEMVDSPWKMIDAFRHEVKAAREEIGRLKQEARLTGDEDCVFCLFAFINT